MLPSSGDGDGAVLMPLSPEMPMKSSWPEPGFYRKLARVADGNQSLGRMLGPGGQVRSGQQGVKRGVGRGANEKPGAGKPGRRAQPEQVQTQGALSACPLLGTVTNRPTIVP